jgi:phenylpropionate dioxygenase-like ring-hydroxylating dioxygenase large terminal subunit
MTETQISPDRVEQLVDRGVRNKWYPIAASWTITDKPVGMLRLGDPIVVWRDGKGDVNVLEDRCPHRGARLSMGHSVGDRLACRYHGVQVTGDGVVASVPAVPKCPLEGEKAVKSYPCLEHMGGIFVWFGDELHPDPAAFDMPEELASDEWAGLLCTAHWKCNYRYAIDNVMDPMHGTYLHAVSHSMSQGDKEAVMRVRDTDTGLVFEKDGQRGVNFDWVEFGDTGTYWMRLTLPYRRNAGPGGEFGIVGFVTPIDTENCRVFFWRTRKVSGWERDVWKFMYRTRLEGLHWDVLEQDRDVLEGMANHAREREFLNQHDTGLARVRRMMDNEAESQLAALAEAGDATSAGALS